MMKKSLFLIFVYLTCITISYAGPVRIMLVGDSITYDDAYIDHPIPRPAGLRHGYRNYLWYKLKDAGYWVDFVGSRNAGADIVPEFDPDNEGYPGETSEYIANIIYDKLLLNTPDIILLHIGSNDWDVSANSAYSIPHINRILNEIDDYEVNYNHHIKVIIARIINRKEYQSWTTTLNHNIQNLVNNRKLDGDDIVVVDMEYGAGINYHTDFQDRTHPNDIGYSKMATVWFNALKPYMVPDYSWLVAIQSTMLN